MFQVDILNNVTPDVVQQFVLSNQHSLVYSSRHFIELVAMETQSTSHWVTVRDKLGMRGVLPLLVKHGAFGPIVNSLPFFGSNGGVISREGDTMAKIAVFGAFSEFCGEINASASTIITNPLFDDLGIYEAYLQYDLRDQRIGQFTRFPLDGKPNSLMSQFDDPRPRNIRKAERLGIQVISSQSDDDLEFLHATHDQNIRLIGGLPKRRAFFDAIPLILPRDGWRIYVAQIDGERLAALLLLYYNQTVEYFTPCVVERHRSSQALPLLIYRAMTDAMAAGYRQWNWGGTWHNQDGVYAFKKKWGTIDLPYYYFTRLLKPQLRILERDVLLREYPGFFVLPFSALSEKNVQK